MTDSYRITIRNVDPELADLLREMADDAGITLGDAFDEAVIALENFWREDEPETDLTDQRFGNAAA